MSDPDCLLSCAVCGRESAASFADSLRGGWERCCGSAMRLVRTDADIAAAVRSTVDPAAGSVVIRLADLRELVFVAAGAATGPLLRDHPAYEFPGERVRAAVEQVLGDWGLHDPAARTDGPA